MCGKKQEYGLGSGLGWVLLTWYTLGLKPCFERPLVASGKPMTPHKKVQSRHTRGPSIHCTSTMTFVIVLGIVYLRDMHHRPN